MVQGKVVPIIAAAINRHWGIVRKLARFGAHLTVEVSFRPDRTYLSSLDKVDLTSESGYDT